MLDIRFIRLPTPLDKNGALKIRWAKCPNMPTPLRFICDHTFFGESCLFECVLSLKFLPIYYEIPCIHIHGRVIMLWQPFMNNVRLRFVLKTASTRPCSNLRKFLNVVWDIMYQDRFCICCTLRKGRGNTNLDFQAEPQKFYWIHFRCILRTRH